MLPCVGREHDRLSVTDDCRWRGDDGTSMLLRVPESLVNIAHFQKINELGRCLPIETFLRLPHGRGQDALPAPTPAAAPPASPSAATSKEAHDEE
jgi:hypothetical protein